MEVGICCDTIRSDALLLLLWHCHGGERLVGGQAPSSHQSELIFSAKRFIGRKFDEVQERPSLPYNIVSGKNGDAHIECEVSGKKGTAPEQISAMILGKLKSMLKLISVKLLPKRLSPFWILQRCAPKRLDAGKLWPK